MKRTFASIALLVLGSMAAFAQAGSTAPATTPAATTAPAALPTGSKVAVIAMQDAIAGSNEGQRDLEALAKKFEPRRLELQKLNTDIEELKKQLSTQGDKMNADAHENACQVDRDEAEMPAAVGGRCSKRISAAAERNCAAHHAETGACGHEVPGRQWLWTYHCA